jgi:hypothetical protein
MFSGVSGGGPIRSDAGHPLGRSKEFPGGGEVTVLLSMTSTSRAVANQARESDTAIASNTVDARSGSNESNSVLFRADIKNMMSDTRRPIQ